MDVHEFSRFMRFTPDEEAAWEKVRAAAAAVMDLSHRDGVHPMESEEMAHAFHDIQARLLARPGLRFIRDFG